MRWVYVFWSLMAIALFACGQAATVQKPTAVFHPTENPKYLSDWGIFSVGEKFIFADGVTPYDLNTPLFTDYAHKLRTIWMPAGAVADYREGDVLSFPVGTVISKTFYYPTTSNPAAFEGVVLKDAYEDGRVGSALNDLKRVRLVETRLLVRREERWEPISYVWNDAQTDAVITRIGDAQPLILEDPAIEDPSLAKTAFTYIVPNINQCAGCHAPNNTTRAISPIGPKPRHLNKDFIHGETTTNQLAHLAENGYLQGLPSIDSAPRNANWYDKTASVDARARAYLDANCAHCHNPVGPADTSGLTLTPDAPFDAKVGLCKLPIAAGAGTGGRRYGIAPGAPDESIFVYRMESTDPSEMMPELGRSLSHDEGVALIRDWIAAMDGECG